MAWHPALDDMERRADDPWSRPQSQFRDNRDPETAAREGRMGSGDCWCGGPAGHDWPGKADGTPHPREVTLNAEMA